VCVNERACLHHLNVNVDNGSIRNQRGVIKAKKIGVVLVSRPTKISGSVGQLLISISINMVYFYFNSFMTIHKTIVRLQQCLNQ
jgi:hypothetical protein